MHGDPILFAKTCMRSCFCLFGFLFGLRGRRGNTERETRRRMRAPGLVRASVRACVRSRGDCAFSKEGWVGTGKERKGSEKKTTPRGKKGTVEWAKKRPCENGGKLVRGSWSFGLLCLVLGPAASACNQVLGCTRRGRGTGQSLLSTVTGPAHETGAASFSARRV